MGRKRLIVQADLTSEEDQAFLDWVKQKLRRRKLAEEIRLGLRLQYQVTGQRKVAYPSYCQGSELQMPTGTSEGELGGLNLRHKLRQMLNDL